MNNNKIKQTWINKWKQKTKSHNQNQTKMNKNKMKQITDINKQNTIHTQTNKHEQTHTDDSKNIYEEEFKIQENVDPNTIDGFTLNGLILQLTSEREYGKKYIFMFVLFLYVCLFNVFLVSLILQLMAKKVSLFLDFYVLFLFCFSF